jgi:hypothetical protein
LTGGNDVPERDFFEAAAYRACGDVLAVSKSPWIFCERDGVHVIECRCRQVRQFRESCLECGAVKRI